MSNPYVIYALVDPRSDRPVYVGKTNDPDKRLRDHTNGGSNWDLREWVDELKKDGLKPEMMLLDFTTEREAVSRERELIRRLDREFGLLNHHHSISRTTAQDAIQAVVNGGSD